MLDLNDVFYFVQVVDRGGFTSAGTTLRLPKSTLSHRIRELEAALGVRLLNRTSRQPAHADTFYRVSRLFRKGTSETGEIAMILRHRASHIF